MRPQEVLDEIEQRVTEAERHVSLCGPCDGGLPMACICPKDDPRDAIAGLIAVTRSQNAALRAVLDLHRPMTADEARGKHGVRTGDCADCWETHCETQRAITEALGADA